MLPVFASSMHKLGVLTSVGGDGYVKMCSLLTASFNYEENTGNPQHGVSTTALRESDPLEGPEG